jgi:hypothetical protein
MATSNEGAELRLVSSIRYKLANVSGDERKLSDALQSQLVQLLEKAGSPHKAVRDAVRKLKATLCEPRSLIRHNRHFKHS